MGAPRTKTGLNVLVPLLLISSTVRAQSGLPPASGAAGTPQTPALAAMQKSLAQQQAALDDFRDHAQSASLRQQRESVAAQVQPLQPTQTDAIASRSQTPPSQAGTSGSSDFFSLPWPGSLPLSMPNVQVANNSCEALPAAEVDKLLRTAASKHGLDSELLRSVMKQESAFKPCALSVAGAMGLMQIMPDTAEMFHLDDPFDPARNVDAGASFLKTMLERFGGDVPLALAAYNAGPGTVDKAGGVPPIAETLQYVTKILGELPIAY